MGARVTGRGEGELEGKLMPVGNENKKEVNK